MTVLNEEGEYVDISEIEADEEKCLIKVGGSAVILAEGEINI